MRLIKAFTYPNMSKSDQDNYWKSLSSKLEILNERVESDELFNQLLGF